MLIIGSPLVSTVPIQLPMVTWAAIMAAKGDGCDGGGGEGGGREHIRSSAPGTNSGDFSLLLVVAPAS